MHPIRWKGGIRTHMHLLAVLCVCFFFLFGFFFCPIKWKYYTREWLFRGHVKTLNNGSYLEWVRCKHQKRKSTEIKFEFIWYCMRKGGWIRLIVGFQPLMVISPTASWIRWYICRCMRGDLIWTCLVWAEQSTPDSFWVPSHQSNSATGEQKEITQTIYTDSEPPSRMF